MTEILDSPAAGAAASSPARPTLEPTGRQGPSETIRAAWINALALVLAAAIGGLTVWVGKATPASATGLNITVRDQSGTPIARATVAIDVRDQHDTKVTSDDGLAFFRFEGKGSSDVATVIVEHPQYKRQSREVTLAPEPRPFSIVLAPLPVKSGVPSGVQPNNGTLSQDEISQSFASQPLRVPTGSGWSAWQIVCSDAPPAGHVVYAAWLFLEGDYACGVWAECQVTELSPTRACARFRLRGRSDGLAALAAPYGFLNVRVKPRA